MKKSNEISSYRCSSNTGPWIRGISFPCLGPPRQTGPIKGNRASAMEMVGGGNEKAEMSSEPAAPCARSPYPAAQR